MNRFQVLGMAIVMTCALTVSAQTQWTTDSAAVQKHVQVLGEKLGLTADQKEKITPMLQEMHDTAAKAQADTKLSADEKQSQVTAAQRRADGKIRTVLNDEQKKKLDVLEAEMHQEHAH